MKSFEGYPSLSRCLDHTRPVLFSTAPNPVSSFCTCFPVCAFEDVSLADGENFIPSRIKASNIPPHGSNAHQIGEVQDGLVNACHLKVLADHLGKSSSSTEPIHHLSLVLFQEGLFTGLFLSHESQLGNV